MKFLTLLFTLFSISSNAANLKPGEYKVHPRAKKEIPLLSVSNSLQSEVFDESFVQFAGTESVQAGLFVAKKDPASSNTYSLFREQMLADGKSVDQVPTMTIVILNEEEGKIILGMPEVGSYIFLTGN